MMSLNVDKKGMVGIITVVLIMALLMSVSISYLKMMEVEGEIQELSDYSERATDAAFAGVSYAMSIAQGSKDIFKGAAYLQNRPYLVKEGLASNAPVGLLTYVNLTRPILSKWLYLDETMTILEDEVDEPPYRFRAITYPCASSTAPTQIDPERYIVKAQGNYMSYETGTQDVVATFTAQIIAELFVSTANKRLYLKRYRTVPYQSDTDFFKYFSRLK